MSTEPIRRCSWCGDWCYRRRPCTACATPFHTPAVRSTTHQSATSTDDREVQAA